MAGRFLPHHASIFLATAAMLATSCGKQEPAPRDTPKQTTADPQHPAAPQTPDVQPPAARQPSDAIWIIPDGWRTKSDLPPSRLATFLIDDPDGELEVAVTRFPGDVGGMLANINRWRGQIGLGEVSDDDLPQLLEPFTTNGFEGRLVHLQGPSQHILAASIFETAQQRTWFVRVTTSPQAAERIKDDVFAFARSFSLDHAHDEPAR
ncbi:MAG: hypothetical protein KF866_05975 [Phycisphaeraceae bacterium]|nr:hypothetical protein [Phycisphaeraceae bacterium]MCW5754542.1 hypothetical protein [Phycisphaeraceae bacterium]